MRTDSYINGGPVLQGPAAIHAAQALREQIAADTQWPYPWSYPPPGATRVTAGADASGSLLVPVAGTLTQGLLYKVSEGFQFALTELVVEYLNDGAHGKWKPGAATWSLTRNQPVGVFTFQGSPVQGLTNVDVGLGALQIPWPLECAEVFQPNDEIRVVFTNSSILDGDPNYFKAILLGWKWPVA